MQTKRLNAIREKEAKRAASYIRARMDETTCLRNKIVLLAFQLGTGWGDAVVLYRSITIPFSTIPGFPRLGKLGGHRRAVEIGFLDAECAGDPIAILRGRVHLYESPSGESVPRAARLQISMMAELGVGTFVLTCAAGSLDPAIRVGTLALIDSFVMFGNEVMPLWVGDEFVSPEDALEAKWTDAAVSAAKSAGISMATGVGHAYVRGPHFEGRRHDKGNLRKLGARTVGMSLKPECSTAALYGARVLAVAFVSNDDVEEHDDGQISSRVKAAGDKLGAFLVELAPALT